MTQTAGRTAWYVERFDEFVRSLNGSSSARLLTQRKEAMDAFVELGFPTARDEEWRYTSLATLLRQDFGVVEKLGEEVLSDVDAWRVPNLQSHVLVFIDGKYQPALSGGASLTEGVRVSNLASLLHRDGEVRDGTSLAPRGKDAFV